MDEFNLHEPRLANPYDATIASFMAERKKCDEIYGHDVVEKALEKYMEESLAETQLGLAWDKMIWNKPGTFKALVEEILKTIEKKG